MKKLSLQVVLSFLESYLEDKQMKFKPGTGYTKRWYDKIEFDKLSSEYACISYSRMTIQKISREDDIHIPFGSDHREYLETLGVL